METQGLLCHCDQTSGLPDQGHPPGAPGCSSKVPARAEPSWSEVQHGAGPENSMAAAAILKELARLTPDPQARAQHLASVAILRDADREFRAQDAYYLAEKRKKLAEELLRDGTPGEKAKAKQRLVKVEALFRTSSERALALRWKNAVG